MKFVMSYSCGESGEYHTLVTDGPIFHRPLAFKTGKILDFGMTRWWIWCRHKRIYRRNRHPGR